MKYQAQIWVLSGANAEALFGLAVCSTQGGLGYRVYV